MRAGAVGIVVGMAAVMLSACAASNGAVWDPSSVASATEHAQSLGYTEAVDALADGTVTREEWRSLHEGWVGCQEALGLEFAPPALDPVNQLEFLEKREYTGSGSGPDEGGMQQCDDRYDFSVGQIYYLSVEPSMNPELLAATRACLDAAGIRYTGDESKYQDFFPGADPQAAAEGPVAGCGRRRPCVCSPRYRS